MRNMCMKIDTCQWHMSRPTGTCISGQRFESRRLAVRGVLYSKFLTVSENIRDSSENHYDYRLFTFAATVLK
jgi:hypothetical protein